MKFTKSLRLALNILLHSKLRSWLTIIGIVIGVAAIVAIVSIGQGLQQNVQNSLGGLGADIITINPGGGRAEGGFRGGGGGGGGGGEGGAIATTKAKNLTKKDVQVLQAVQGIDQIGGTVSGRADTYYLGQTASISVNGVDPVVWSKVTTSELDAGRFLNAADYDSVVIGGRIAASTFKQPLSLNQVITIAGKPFKIIGILHQSGNFGSEDSRIIMPIKAARDTIDGIGEEKFDSIVVKAENPDIVDQVMADIQDKLLISRHLTAKTVDFSVSSSKSIQERLTTITQTLTIFLGAIAAVSLLVGAVGIANTMFTSVLEKTKEIGIMKSIGAKNSDILTIFVLNSAMVGLVGGLLGVAFGAFISSLLPRLGLQLVGPGSRNGLVTAISPSLLITALLLSVAIGVISGAIPARRASKLKPVDALRYE